MADGKRALKALAADNCGLFADEINDGLEHEEALAYFLAGTLYDATDCVEQDYRRAAAFYRRAVELGNEEAAKFLGLMYGLGRGVDQDYATAFRWLNAGRPPPAAAAGDETDPVLRAEVRGYALTVNQLARSKVRYPKAMDGEEVYVELRIRSREFTFSVDSRGGKREPLPRPSMFTSAIADAYAYALSVAPRTDAIERSDLVYITPWRFERR